MAFCLQRQIAASSVTSCAQMGMALSRAATSRHAAAVQVPRPHTRPQVSATAATAAASSEHLSELVLNHRALMAKLPSMRCNIAGVSFEGRQELVKELRKSMPVLLVPEPSNPHDAKGVAVHTLSGGQLGYVPRTVNEHLTERGLMPAYVLGVGPAQGADKELWGAHIWTSPSAIPLLPPPLPKALRPTSSSSPSPELAELRRLLDPSSGPGSAALKTSKQTCELTAVPASKNAPLQLVPLWKLDLAERVARLLRVVVATAPVARAFDFLSIAPGDREYNQSRRLVEQFNQWQPAELDQYVAWARQVEAEMDAGEPWRVDLALPAQTSA